MPRGILAESVEQMTVRLESSVSDRADAVGARLSRPGLDVTRSAVVRMALLEGLTVLERELGIKAVKDPPSKPAAKKAVKKAKRQ